MLFCLVSEIEALHNPSVVIVASFQSSFVSVVALEANDHLSVAAEALFLTA